MYPSLSRPTRGAPRDTPLQAVLAEAWELEGEPIEDALFGRAEEIWAFRAAMAQELPLVFPQIEICDFGHLGDGGLHFNLVAKDGPRFDPFGQGALNTCRK